MNEVLYKEMEQILRDLVECGTFYCSAIEIHVYDGASGEEIGNRIEKVLEEIDNDKTRTEG